MNRKRRPFKTHTEFDGPIRRNADGSQEVISLQNKRHAHDLMVTALLSIICNQTEGDPERKQLLFTGLCNKFKGSQLSSFFTVGNLEACHPIRTKLEQFLLLMIKRERDNVGLQLLRDSDTPVEGFPLVRNPSIPTSVNNLSRYKEEFHELDVIDKGGFGVVCKVRSLNDNVEYAVKKISVDHRKRITIENIVREVHIYAKLSHPNIVSYKTSWFEMLTPGDKGLLNLPRGEDTDSDSSVPTDGYQEWSHVKCSTSVDSCVGATALTSVHQNEAFKMEACASNGYVRDVGLHMDDLTYQQYSTLDHMETCVVYGSSSHVKITELPASPKEDSMLDRQTTKDSLKAFEANTLLGSLRSRHGSGATTKSHSDTEVPLLRDDAERQNLFPPFPMATDFNRLGISRQNSLEVPTHAVLFILMELCSKSLKTWLDKRRRENMEDSIEKPNVVLGIFKQVLQGVHYIHSNKIIHRDLKPANILFSMDGETIKIVDFGLARSCLCNEDIGNQDGPLRCQHGCLNPFSSGVGTGVYIAPEQKKGKKYDNKADMYSLGIILLELVYPFGTEMEKQNSINKLITERSVPDVVVESWPEIGEMILRLTDKDPQKRPSAEDILKSSLFNEKSQEIVRLRNSLKRKESIIHRKSSHINKLEAENARLRKLLEAHGIAHDRAN